MKILFDNALEDATLTALYASPNYPVANLSHRILKKRFQSILNSDTITMSWAAAVVVNSIYVGYTNATAFVLRLYNASSTLLATISFTPSDMAKHFAAVSGVRSAQLDISNSLTSVYLGGVGIGEDYTMPDPRNDWGDGFVDKSKKEVSADGQVFGDRIEPLRMIPLNFFSAEHALYREIRDLVKPNNRIVPLWVDVFESWHEEMLPMYGTLDLGDPKKRDKKIDFSIAIQEAR
jgi:hypothetical protein